MLKNGGKVILTVPAPFVDNILKLLRYFNIIDGMDIDEHWGFKVNRTISIFENAVLKLITHKKFQFGLNNLFVFEK